MTSQKRPRVTIAYAIRVDSAANAFFLDHLARSLSTAIAQTEPCRIVLIDYGSSPPWSDRIESVAIYYGADELFHVPAAVWSRGRAMNVAVRAADTPYLATMDADCLMDEGYVAKALSLAGLQTFVLSCVRRLKDGQGCRTADQAEDAPARCVHPAEGHGLVCVPAEWMRRVRGYDERYEVWGQEDSDLVERARADGMDVRQLPMSYAPHHLPHPGPEAWTDPGRVARAKARNVAILAETKRLRRVVAPQDAWGMG